MPELSERERERLAKLEPWFAATRLVVALERHWEIHFRCLSCGAQKSWRRDTMLARAHLLNSTMAEIQAAVPCPQCGRRQPRMRMSGVMEPGAMGERLRLEVITTLLDAGLNPSAYGYGWRPAGGSR